jgi:hypothetical protein
LGLYIARRVAARDGLELEFFQDVEVDPRDRIPAKFRLKVAE